MTSKTAAKAARWVLGAALAASAIVGPTLPARANDAEGYVANAVQCAIWAVTDPARHDELCVDTVLSGPYSSIQSTGSHVAYG